MFDLTIENYSIRDFHELLQLSEPCTTQDIHDHCHSLKQSIEQDTTMNVEKRQQVMSFLDKVRIRLETHYASSSGSVGSAGSSDSILSASLQGLVSQSSQVAPTHSIQFPSGTRDPIYRETLTKVVSIDSKYRKQYYRTKASDFHVVLHSPIKQAISMKLHALELPNSMFPISSQLGNNVFFIRDSTDSEYRRIEIPGGQYSFDAIVNVLTIEINSLGGVYVGYQVGHSSEPLNARIVIRSSIDDTGNSFSLKFFDASIPNTTTNLMGTLGWLLGFRLNEYTNNTTYVGEGLFDGGGNRYLLMRVDDFNKNSNDSFITNYAQSIHQDNILARIQVRAPVFSLNYNTSSEMVSQTRDYFGPVTIERLHVQLLNEYGQTIDLNHMDYSFALEFECLR